MLLGPLLLGVTLAAVPASNDLTAPAAPQPIIGGEPTVAGEFDGVVAIVAGEGLCTGTVVAPRLVLTAGHCLSALRPGQEVGVFYGDELNPAMQVAAEDWGVHPEFCSTCKQDIFDYGYVLIEGTFSLPGGFLLPLVDQDEWDDSMRKGQDVTVVGYGEDPDSPTADKGIGVKRKVGTEIRKFSNEGLEFFAGGDERDSCAGDSGGPAFVRVADGSWRLAGIVSRGTNPCGDGGFYGVPFPALFWVRDETGIDLLPTDCESESCLDTSPPDDGACSLAPPTDRPPAWFVGLIVLGGLAAAARRRRSA